MKRKKKLTRNQQLYKKEIKRLKRGIKSAERRGYYAPEAERELQIPKRVTKKALERIQKLKPSDIYKKGKFINIETGEIISTAATEIKRRRSRKPKQRRKILEQDIIREPTTTEVLTDDVRSDIIIENFRKEIYVPVILKYVDQKISEIITAGGKKELAEALEERAVTLLQFIQAGKYGYKEGTDLYFMQVLELSPFEFNREEKEIIQQEIDNENDFYPTELEWEDI